MVYSMNTLVYDGILINLHAQHSTDKIVEDDCWADLEQLEKLQVQASLELQ
jgi:hypothetical protein